MRYHAAMSASKPSSELVLWTHENGVTTLTMNNPAKLNGWTMEMMEAFKAALSRAADDAETRAVIFTGVDPYYSAGVNLGSTLKLGHPAQLHGQIVAHNQALFEAFIQFPKPILAVVNGPAIGASVTSATICDAILASENATFHTPFAALGIPPEGCSSLLFPRLLGDAAERMLGQEGWKPTGQEAQEAGLADHVAPHDRLMDEARRMAEGWVESGKAREYRGGVTQAELEAVNARESVDLATAFLSPPFLRAQYRFLRGKGKLQPAMLFLALLLTRPAWSLLLPRHE